MSTVARTIADAFAPAPAGAPTRAADPFDPDRYRAETERMESLRLMLSVTTLWSDATSLVDPCAEGQPNADDDDLRNARDLALLDGWKAMGALIRRSV